MKYSKIHNYEHLSSKLSIPQLVKMLQKF